MDDRLTNKIDCIAELLDLSTDDVAILSKIAGKLEFNEDEAAVISSALDILVANNIRNNQLVEILFSGNVNNTTSAEFDIPTGQYMAILCDGGLVISQYLSANGTWQNMTTTAEPGEQMMCVGDRAKITTTGSVNVTIIRAIQ